MQKKELVQNDTGPMSVYTITDIAAKTDQSVVKKAGEPPVCAVSDEIQSATIGIPFSIYIVASVPEGWITGIEAVNLPMWATLNIITKLPAADVIAVISGTPGPEDANIHVMSIVATDNDNNQAVSSLMIKVEEDVFKDQHPEEKKCFSNPFK